MALPDLAEAAGRAVDVYGVHGISVELAIDVSVLEACRGQPTSGALRACRRAG
jgi:hypothetical protein